MMLSLESWALQIRYGFALYWKMMTMTEAEWQVIFIQQRLLKSWRISDGKG